MSGDKAEQLNRFLVKVFNEILRIEEGSLKQGEFSNISVRGMHVIEAVCNANKTENDNRASDVAQALGISAGTLTTEAALLEKKGCISRRRDKDDKRIIRLYPTEKGERANAAHQEFHRQMVESVMKELTDEQTESLVRGLKILESFFMNR